jgi:two-component system nitrogen regulation response regulator GlnG
VGGHSPLKSNVRVIAATHQNLEERVRQGGFREDLFHRLNVIRLRLPALRERREDIPVLARYFLQRSATELGVEPKRLSEAALAKLVVFDFPGNVRQLENVCHWLSVMAPSQVVEAKDLPQELLQPPTAALASAAAALQPLPPSPAGMSVASDLPPANPALAGGPDAWVAEMAREARRLLASGEPEVWELLTRRFEASLILTALDLTRGRRIEAAQKLGIGRNTITRKIQELGLDA